MLIIGRKDKINLPALGLENVPAKIDTGAYGCALHCHHIELVEFEGKHVLRFKVLDPSHDNYQNKFYYAENFSLKKVKSSVGEAQKRFAIVTKMVLFGKEYKVTFTLTDRKKMRYPILIGRKFINKRFLVDVSLQDLSYNHLKIEAK